MSMDRREQQNQIYCKEIHSSQRTGESVETKLQRIAKYAGKRPRVKFKNLIHLINKESLLASHRRLSRKKSTGVDNITKEEYGKDLSNNIEKLLKRMKEWSYIPHPDRLQW